MAASKIVSSSTKSIQKNTARLTVVQKLLIPTVLLRVFGRVIVSIFSSFTQPKSNKPPSLFRYVMYTLIRNLTDLTTTEQLHYITPTTDAAYLAVCKARRVEPNTIVLDDGTAAHWIGSPNAKKILINHHGGGYVLQASAFMVDYMFRIQQEMEKKGKSFAVLFVSYDLAPEARYPRQLQQAAGVLKHVTEVLGRSPSDIFLSGDSAGGNLTVSLISHLSHPHPDATIPRVKLSSKLAGVVLVSPWIDFTIDDDAIKGRKDLIGPITGKKWSAAWLGTPWPHKANADNYNQATLAPASWWEDAQFEEALVMAGADELLRPGIEKFAKRWQQDVKSLGEKKVTYFCGVGEAHDAPSLDLQLKIQKPGPKAKMFYSWMAERI